MLKLRPYQNQSINEIDDLLCQGKKKILLKLPTGAGKTKTMVWFLQRCLNHGLKCLFVVRRRSLVFQTADVFIEEDIDFGIIMSGVRPAHHKNMQIASIDTLKSVKYDYDVIVTDEAHDTVSKKYRAFMSLQDSIFIGPTATPYSPLDHWEVCVTPIEAFEVRDLGNLLPERIFIPNIIDLSGVKRKSGDYNENELAEKMMSSAIVGDAVQHWKRFAQDRPTIGFCANVKHSELMAEAFNENGIPAIHVDADSSGLERKDAKDGLISGKYKVVFNVNIFSTGWDCPSIGCILSLRATQSVILWLQQIGRGFRPNGIDKDCLIIDSTGNTFRHGRPYDVREANLTKEPIPVPKNKELMLINCEACAEVYEKILGQCPWCGHIPEKKERQIRLVNGELVEYTMPEEKIKEIRKQIAIKDYYKAKSVLKIRGWKDEQLVIKAQKQIMKNHSDIYEEIKSELR